MFLSYQLESQPGQSEPDPKEVTYVVQPPKSSSRSSIISKTSLESAHVSVPEVYYGCNGIAVIELPLFSFLLKTEPQSERCEIESQVERKDASNGTPKKSSSKSSIKSKSSKTSLRSTTGSIKNETTTEVSSIIVIIANLMDYDSTFFINQLDSEPGQAEPAAKVTDDAIQPPKSSSKSSVKSKTSKTSLKSAQTSIPEVCYCGNRIYCTSCNILLRYWSSRKLNLTLSNVKLNLK